MQAVHVLKYVLVYVLINVRLMEGLMATITATEARSKLFRLIDETAESHQPVLISGKRNSAVLISEEDWSAIQVTLYLLSIPGMRESIRQGLETPLEKTSTKLTW